MCCTRTERGDYHDCTLSLWPDDVKSHCFINLYLRKILYIYIYVGDSRFEECPLSFGCSSRDCVCTLYIVYIYLYVTVCNLNFSGTIEIFVSSGKKNIKFIIAYLDSSEYRWFDLNENLGNMSL